MTDPDADALYRAIVRYPDDDTPRLVYADWLQENGRVEEGEFLRTQCQLAAAEPSDPEYPALVNREEELRLWLMTHVPGPRLTFPGGLSVEGGSHWWKYSHRGYPSFLEFDGYERYGVKAMRSLASALERAFETLPTRWLVVRFITVAQLTALLKQPVLAGLSHLTVELTATGDEANAAAKALANCRHLRNLRGLSLAFSFGDAGCESLAGAHWGELEWFSPACNEITPVGLRSLASANWFRQLRNLRLANDLPNATFEALSRLPAFPRLHTLDLSKNSFEESAWQAFSTTRTFPALSNFRLRNGDMRDERMTALAAATGFSLRVLNLRKCGTSPGIGAAITMAPWASALQILNLSSSSLESSELKAIAACKKFTELQYLDFGECSISSTGLAALAANPALRGLQTLRIEGQGPFRDSGLTPAHFDRFLTKLNMPDLRHLDLSGRTLGPTAAKKLTDPRFSSLRRLKLNDCKLSDTAVATLVRSPTLRNLIQLELNDNDLTAGPKHLSDPMTLPHLAVCSLIGNPIGATVARKLRRRSCVQGLPKATKRRI